MDDVLDRGTNVVRFPSGRAARPLMESVWEVEPDVRGVLFAAASLGLDMPAAGLRDRVDEETARHIAEQVLPLALSERRLALDGLVAAVAAAALRDVEQAGREGWSLDGFVGGARGGVAAASGHVAGAGLPAVPGGARRGACGGRELDAL